MPLTLILFDRHTLQATDDRCLGFPALVVCPSMTFQRHRPDEAMQEQRFDVESAQELSTTYARKAGCVIANESMMDEV